MTLAEAVRTVPDFPKPGIQFKDITPILADPALLVRAVDQLVAPFAGQGITHVVGIESRGFILGAMLADRLGAGFVPVRKPGKLPGETARESYALEYGSDALDIHIDAFAATIDAGDGAQVLVHDDVIATGGTAAATARLVERAGGTLAGFAFLIELDVLDGRTKLPDGAPVHAILHYD
ncbi:MAG: adenine phosphoribosyltransferase [Bacteroidota bacterium]